MTTTTPTGVPTASTKTFPASAANRGATRTALVTGASSGIGEDTARKLQALGYVVYGAARRTDRLQALATDGIRPLTMDVTDDASMTAGVDRILEETGRIDVLVNNAGYGSHGAIEDVPIDEARRQFEVNVFGLARLTQLVSPHMRAQGSGTIINISSIGGRLTTPLGGWYHATKYAVEALSDALRMELRPFGIDVVVVEPGAIRTAWWSIAADHLEATAEGSAYADQIRAVAGAMRSESNQRRFSPPVVIARTIGKIVTARHPRTRYAVGFMAGPLIAARRILPDRAFDQLIGAAFGFRR
ncbi:short-chain dehydrogenase/reductase [Actinomyces oris]|uniref:oxidoreductase n=1 Tax=Actinomyces TaxID=1654 RepID=UPI00094C5C48|nr:MULTISPECIES: oxidoreductase [Actinomyces]OLO60894.1 short-chain dehydrogenase/reductase [Actinomyces oris]OLO65644.1 short-chain dehydrogenase/reductase [Actinomyces oris]